MYMYYIDKHYTETTPHRFFIHTTSYWVLLSLLISYFIQVLSLCIYICLLSCEMDIFNYYGNQKRFIDNSYSIPVFVSCLRSNGKCWSDGVDRAEPFKG